MNHLFTIIDTLQGHKVTGSLLVIPVAEALSVSHRRWTEASPDANAAIHTEVLLLVGHVQQSQMDRVLPARRPRVRLQQR